ncbi:MAG: sulfotransferase domain-containing protein, partial [Ilumatobacteraceae bacterium]
LRTTLIADQSTRPADDDPGPIVRKTHEQYRRDDPAHEPFPTPHTRAAIFVIRDPRDVASSYASHFGLDLDTAIDSMADTVTGDERGSPFLGITAQVWGSWSEHARSWLDADLPFPVHVIRYEDLQADTVGTLAPVFDAIGFDRTRDQLAAAVERARFDRLRAAEAERGFRETGRRSDTFFRRGTSGAWRDDLTDRQIAAIEADHHEMMTRFGYEPISDPDLRHAVAEARASTRRRRLLRERIAIAPEAGITVEFGAVPETLDGGQDVGRFFHTTPTATIAKLGPRIRMLVERGTDVTVHWPDDVPDRPAEPDTGGSLRSTADGDGIVTDQSWIVQGWAVVIAGLQRGNLSIHASTVRIGDQTVAIVGPSGAGKSTTSMGLRRRGHELLVDDTTMLEFLDRVPYVVPYARNVHLLPDAAAALGVDFDSLHLLGGGRTKAAFLPEAPDPTPRRLDRIVILRRRRSGLDAPMLIDVGPERVAALAEHADRRGLAPAILGHQRVFEQIVDLAAATKVQILVRPDGDWTLDAVLDLIEHPPTGQETDRETDE